MTVPDLQELIVLQTRLTEKANIFLAYFGLSEEITFSHLDQAYKSLPNSLSLGITIELPSNSRGNYDRDPWVITVTIGSYPG